MTPISNLAVVMTACHPPASPHASEIDLVASQSLAGTPLVARLLTDPAESAGMEVAVYRALLWRGEMLLSRRESGRELGGSHLSAFSLDVNWEHLKHKLNEC